MARRFNTAGPCLPAYHYMIPPLERLPEAPGLVAEMDYFVVHAPRQTGKTTALRALAEELTISGEYAALHFSCELGEAYGDDFGGAQRGVLSRIRRRARGSLPPELRPPPWPEAADGDLRGAALEAWAQACPKPLVLFFDEIDALRGQSLISVLCQLRDGFPDRPHAFPASVVLCGQRDVRDCHPRNRFAVPRVPGEAASGGDPNRLGTASPFNIKLESLRLGDFTPAEAKPFSSKTAMPSAASCSHTGLWAGLCSGFRMGLHSGWWAGLWTGFRMGLRSVSWAGSRAGLWAGSRMGSIEPRGGGSLSPGAGLRYGAGCHGG